MKKLRLLFFITVFILTSVHTYAQKKGSIKGRITSSDAIATEDITVRLKGTGQQQTTDGNGSYEFKNVKPGTYIVSISGVGTKADEKTITVAGAETATADFMLMQTADQLREVNIFSRKQGKVVTRESNYVAKMPLKNLENPQSYSTVTKEILTQQQVFTLDDALKNIPGLSKKYEATGLANTSVLYALRGFTIQSNFRDGIVSRTPAGSDNINIESIEVIKGPSATLFGSSFTSYGGLINRITKKPYKEVGGEISATGGSFAFNRLSADFNTPLDSAKKALFRINAAYQDENGFRDNGFRKSVFIAPSFSYEVNEKLTLSMNAEISTVKVGGGFNNVFSFIPASVLRPLFGIPAGVPVDLSVKTMYGVDNVKELNFNHRLSYTANDLAMTTNNSNIMAEANYKISDQWRSQTVVATSISRSSGYQPYMFILPNAVVARNLAAKGYDYALRLVNKPEVQQNSLQLQQNFIGDFKIGEVRNRLTAGLEYFKNKYNQQQNSFSGSVLGITYESLFDIVPLRGAMPNYNNFNQVKVDSAQASGRLSNSGFNVDANSYAAYVADVLNITDRFMVMLSLRGDRFENKPIFNPVNNTSSEGYKQTAFSPKFGAIYQLVKSKVSIFANAQNGFTNTPGVSFEGAAFKPEKALQFEGGLKTDLLDGKLSVTASYYHIKVKDKIRTDVANFGFNIQDGEQLSKGTEFEIMAAPLPGLTVIGGYAYNDTKYTKANADVEGLRPVESGAAHQANFWINYRLNIPSLDGLGAGIGANYSGKSWAVNTVSSGTVALPSYTVLNAALSFDKPTYRIGLKMNNVTNKLYWIGWNAISTQQPRSVLGSITYKF